MAKKLPVELHIFIYRAQNTAFQGLRDRRRTTRRTPFMEGTKPRTVSSLGMFDLLKGIGMLAIVFAHTAELYPLGTDDVTPFAFALFAYR